MASMTSMLTGTYCCHPCTSTLVIVRKINRMLLFNGNQFRHWLIKNLTTRATREGSIDWWCWNHDRNIRWMFQSGLLRNTQFSISLEVQRMIRRLLGILKLGLRSINLERNDISLSSIRKIRANHLGSNLCLGAKAQLVHHAIQMSQQLIF